MNWYAYKVLADTYDAERRQQAAQHRHARQTARSAQARREAASVEPTVRNVPTGRVRSIAGWLRPRRPAGTELRPSLPQ
jgi:hypothetical protein